MRIPPSFISRGLLVLAGLLISPCQMNAQVTEQNRFTPQVEQLIREVKVDLRDKKRSMWAMQMQGEIHDIVQVTGVGQSGIDALNAAARPILDSSADAWAIKAETEFRQCVEKIPGEDSYKEMILLTSISSGPEELMQAEFWVPCTPPLESDAWNAAIHSALNPSQAAVWDKAQATKKNVTDKKIDAGLAPFLKRISDLETKSALYRCSVIETTLGLTGDRKEKLEDIARAAADESSEQWVQSARASLRNMDDSVLTQVFPALGILEPGMHDLGLKWGDEFTLQPKWKAGLTNLLTSQEIDKVRSLDEARKMERVHVMAHVFIMLIDEKIALNTRQRDQLLPLAERLTAGIPDLFPEEGVDYEGSTLSMYYNAAQQATDADLKPALSDVQIQNWRALPTVEPDLGLADTKPPSEPEPEYVESAIARSLYEREQIERRHLLETFTLKANDVIQKTGLDSEKATRLELAARGYVEKQIAAWRYQTEAQVRNQLPGVTAATIDTRLADIQTIGIGLNGETPQVTADNLWDKAVQSELSPAQIAAWKAEVEARESYHITTIASLILSNFDHVVYLTDDQKKKLLPLIEKAVRDYSPDIPRFFSDQGGVPWYLTMGFAMLPINGISEPELSSILNSNQCNIWNNRDEQVLMSGIWPGIQQLHLGRISEEEAAAQAKKAAK